MCSICPCPAGQYESNYGFFSDTVQCTNCAAGTFQAASGAKSCDKCPAGQYQYSSGQSSCQYCPPGQYQNEAGKTACGACNAGQSQPLAGQAACVACAAGQYQPTPGYQTSCSNCATGSYSALGAMSCVKNHNHGWDFRGCETGSIVSDEYLSDLVATPYNGPVCTSSGVTFSSASSQYIRITSYSWGGVTSFETYAVYTALGKFSRIIDFGDGSPSDNVVLSNGGSSSNLNFHGNVPSWCAFLCVL